MKTNEKSKENYACSYAWAARYAFWRTTSHALAVVSTENAAKSNTSSFTGVSALGSSPPSARRL